MNDSLARQPAATKRSQIVPVIRLTVLLAMALALGLWAYGWIQIALVQVHESDARIAVDQVAVSSRMDGVLEVLLPGPSAARERSVGGVQCLHPVE